MKRVMAGFLVFSITIALVSTLWLSRMMPSELNSQEYRLDAVRYVQRLVDVMEQREEKEFQFTTDKPVWSEYSMTFTAFNWTDTDVDGIMDLLPAFKTFVGDLGRYFTQITTNLARVVPNTINNIKNYFGYYLTCIKDLGTFAADVVKDTLTSVSYWKHLALCLLPIDWDKMAEDGYVVHGWYEEGYRGGR